MDKRLLGMHTVCVPNNPYSVYYRSRLESALKMIDFLVSSGYEVTTIVPDDPFGYLVTYARYTTIGA
ncbi:MAG: hypothetical protein KF716_14245 [Anaerolineae bacterium]|nr:hypothetical protein [Anaerolineae bacterium]